MRGAGWCGAGSTREFLRSGLRALRGGLCFRKPAEELYCWAGTMKTQTQVRDDFKKTLDHIDTVYSKLQSNTGRGRAFSFADAHKLAEGLLLSAWTHWEEFLRELLLIDVASDSSSALCSEVRKFRVKGGPLRVAERMINHPDHPEKYVNWDFDIVKSRADALLPASHRFTVTLANAGER